MATKISRTLPFLLAALGVVSGAVSGASDDAAKALDWLYEVDIQVVSQADVERRRAAGPALKEVLARISGMVALPAHPELDAALRQPELYYARYEYSQRRAPRRPNLGDEDRAVAEPPATGQGQPRRGQDADEPAPGGVAPTLAPPAMFLSFHFQPSAVQALLRRANLPIWPTSRPSVLAWVAVERNNRRWVVAATDEDNMTGTFAERGRKRGLALLLPLMDLHDRTVTPTDIIGRFWERIEAASSRYATDLLLLGSVRQQDGVWRGEWELRARRLPVASLYDMPIAAGQSVALRTTAALAGAFRHDADSATHATQLALDAVADRLADRFAVRGETGATEVIVYGAQTVRGYASLMAYLRSREFIDQVHVGRLVADRSHLRLRSRSSREQLLDLLALDGLLSARDADANAASLVWQGAK